MAQLYVVIVSFATVVKEASFFAFAVVKYERITSLRRLYSTFVSNYACSSSERRWAEYVA